MTCPVRSPDVVGYTGRRCGEVAYASTAARAAAFRSACAGAPAPAVSSVMRASGHAAQGGLAGVAAAGRSSPEVTG